MRAEQTRASLHRASEALAALEMAKDANQAVDAQPVVEALKAALELAASSMALEEPEAEAVTERLAEVAELARIHVELRDVPDAGNMKARVFNRACELRESTSQQQGSASRRQQRGTPEASESGPSPPRGTSQDVATAVEDF